MAAEYVGHHAHVMSAAVRDDGSLILCGSKVTGEIFSLVMDNSGYPLNVDEVNVAGSSIYPNPASDFVMIETENETEVKIYSVSGQMVLRHNVSEGTNTIDVSKLNSGIYFIDVEGVMNKVVVR